MSDETVRKLVTSVQVYADPDAFRRDQFQRSEYFKMKPVHDELFQLAISLKLATSILLTRRRGMASLPEGFTMGRARPKWYPANRSPSKLDLLIAPVTAFQQSWAGLRASVERRPKDAPLWSDDPALVFECSPGVFMCRTACVGHEGEVLYFVYRNEATWQQAVERSGSRLLGKGEECYRKWVPVPGKYAE